MSSYPPLITKEEIAGFETEAFPGRIILVTTPEEADKAVDYLMTFPYLGFDTETRPNFKKGETPHKVALMQISTPDVCVLFRLNLIGFTPSLAKLLRSGSVQKIGLSLNDDFGAIRQRQDIRLANFIDLQTYVKPFGIEEMSLQKIYAILFGKKISKSQRLTNWEADVLTEQQQMYAALDAWACLKIYEHL